MSESVPPSAPTTLRLRYESPESFLRSYLHDPGLKGIRITSSAAVAIGTQVDVTIELGSGKGLRISAEVVATQAGDGGRGGILALSFRNMAPASQAWLDKAVAQHLASKDDALGEVNREHLLRKATSALDLTGARDELVDSPMGKEQDPVIGIDLGTSNSCVCAHVAGKPVILELGDGEIERPGVKHMPSVVAYEDEGRVTVGRRALEGLRRNPRRTIWGSKRFIGRAYESPVVHRMLSHFPYKIVPGPGGRVSVDIDGRAVNLVAISAKILTHIRERAANQLGRQVKRAIITVPAFYNDNQRDAVVKAGRLAGLTVERIINEPTAAAIAYGLTRAKPRRLLVFDLGGGTFDVSVMSVYADSLQVLSTAGDTFLGGEDFDNALVEHVYAEHHRKNKKAQLSTNHAARALIKTAAEQAKRRLSEHAKTSVVVREALLRDGGTTRVEVEITREAFERAVEPLIERTLRICDMAVSEARLQLSDLADVILVGGQTRMPKVQEMVRTHFKLAPRCDLDPDEVVALGAGMLAYLPKEQAHSFKDVLSMSIGVAIGKQLKPLVPRNTQLPAKKSFRFSLSKERFATYNLDVWQGDHEQLHQNEFLGSLSLNALAPGPKNPIPIQVDFVLGSDCLLKLRVTHLETQESQEVLLNTRDS